MITIGFFGATANGPYNFAKQVHQNGHKKIIFIIDRDMKRVQQHPLWSDKKTFITYSEFNNSQNWTYDKWIRWEKKNKWIKPTWVKSYVIKNRDGYFYNNYEKIILELNKCDILFLNGTNILNKSDKINKPYIIWPHGSDIRVTANIEKIDFNSIKSRVNYFFFRSRLKKGFKRAKLIGSHTPSILNICKEKKLNSVYQWMPFPISLAIKQKIKRSKLLKDLGLNINQNKKIIFVPSRIDYEVKKHNIILDAFNSCDLDEYVLIFTGWGRDYKKLKKESKKNKNIFFLKYCLSQVYLIEFFKISDIVIDQFSGWAAYGTSFLEAVSAGCPVITNIIDEEFINNGWNPPPVINVKNKNELQNIFKKIKMKRINLSKISEKLVLWLKKNHDSKIYSKMLLEKLQKILDAV